MKFYEKSNITLKNTRFLLPIPFFPQVIPAFHEENYRQQDSEFHAIPSKSELASEAVLLQQESVRPGDEPVNLINSRQGKKAPLPHEHEPHTIVGITVGAFLLIFIGTGKIFFYFN